MPKVMVTIMLEVNNSEATEADLLKLHRKIECKEKVCCAQKLGSQLKVKVTIRSNRS